MSAWRSTGRNSEFGSNVMNWRWYCPRAPSPISMAETSPYSVTTSCLLSSFLTTGSKPEASSLKALFTCKNRERERNKSKRNEALLDIISFQRESSIILSSEWSSWVYIYRWRWWGAKEVRVFLYGHVHLHGTGGLWLGLGLSRISSSS